MASPEAEALGVLLRVVADHDLRLLVVGALARQEVFDRRFEGAAYRATRDIDAAIRVDDWDQFENVVRALRAAGFARASDYRLRYRNGVEIDLLPFGGVVDADGLLDRRSGDRRISAEGIATADAHSETSDPFGVEVRVASLPSLILLKIYAFRDRAPRGIRKDLDDLVYIFENASDALHERIYGELGEIVSEQDYDENGPFLLGADVASIVDLAEREKVEAIVERMVLDPRADRHLARVGRGTDPDGVRRWFRAFLRGLRATIR